MEPMLEKLAPLFILLIFSCANPIENQEKEDYVDLDKTITEREAEEILKNHKEQPAPELYSLDSLRSVIEKSDQIIAYNFNGEANPAWLDDGDFYIIGKEGQLHPSAENEIILNSQLAKRLKGLLTNPLHYESTDFLSLCYAPHIGFVFYQQKKVIGQSNVCFMCTEVRSVPNATGTLSKMGGDEIMEYCKSLGLKIVVK